MAEADIDVTKCEPLIFQFLGDRPHRLRWINNESSERKVTFNNGVPALFLGSSSPPIFTVPPHGAIEFEAKPNEYQNGREFGCEVTGAGCGVIRENAKGVVVGP